MYQRYFLTLLEICWFWHPWPEIEVPSWICSYSLKHMCWSRWNVKLSKSLSLSVSESLKIEIKERINFFCSLLALQRAGAMGRGVHWVLCLPGGGIGQETAGGPCLGLPQVGFVTFMSLKLPKVPAGLFLADLRCSPLWASYLISWFHTEPSTCSPWLLSLDFTCFPRSSPAVFVWNFLCAVCPGSLCFFPAVLFARIISFANINWVIVSNQVMPALSSVPMLICLSSPLLACLANSWSSVWLKPGLLILTPRGLSLTSFSESWAKYQHHLLFSPVNSAFLACCFFYGHTQGNSRSCRILLTYSEIQHLLSHWEFKPSPASLHLVSQLLSFASSLTNLTFIFKIHRDCQDCCLSLFFWSCHTSLCIPGLNLPSLFYQPIAKLFFFQALHGCCCSSSAFQESVHSTNFHHSFIQFS